MPLPDGTPRSLKNLSTIFKHWPGAPPKHISPEASVLEIAPGPGYFSIELAKLGNFQITGLDISKTFVEIAQANAAKAGVRVDFRQGNASNMPFADEIVRLSAVPRGVQEFQRADAFVARNVSRSEARWTSADYRSAKRLVHGIDQPGMQSMNVGAVNAIITKLTFRHMLLKRAYTKSEFEEMISQTHFADREDSTKTLIGLEILLSKKQPGFQELGILHPEWGVVREKRTVKRELAKIAMEEGGDPLVSVLGGIFAVTVLVIRVLKCVPGSFVNLDVSASSRRLSSPLQMHAHFPAECPCRLRQSFPAWAP